MSSTSGHRTPDSASAWKLMTTFSVGFCLALVYQNYCQEQGTSATTNVLPTVLEPTLTNGRTPRSPDKPYDVTIITGFYDIGEFRKKQSWRRRTRALYHEWMQLWSHVENKVVAFFDDQESADIFKQARVNLPTEIFMVDRYSLPAFQDLYNVTKILSQPGYPQLYPETMTPEYSCVNNLKYDLVKSGLTLTEFRSEYYAWLDIGTFNYHVNRIHKPFTISLPDEADLRKVMYTQVDPYQNLTAQTAFHQRKRWLGAGAFLGRKDVLLGWADKYRESVMYFLSRGLVCNDQAILYGMTLPAEKGGVNLRHMIQPLPMVKWHDRGYELVYLYETTWRYPLTVCTEQIDVHIRKTCLGF